MSFFKQRDTRRRRNNRGPFPIDRDPITQHRNDAKHIRTRSYK
jgi:hypothetical protein